MESTGVKTKRNANMELLRLISMCMVVMLHGLWKGDNLKDLSVSFTLTDCTAWLLECLSVVAVNLFILTSGYFLCRSKFKLERLIELVCQVLFFTIGTFAVSAVFKVGELKEFGIYELVKTVFPIHSGVYWFVTAYVAVYLLSPLLNKGISMLKKDGLGIVIICLVIYESLFKSLLPIRFENDEKGYGILWFIIVYLIGAYLRNYGFKHLSSPGRGLALYFAGVALMFIEIVGIQHMVGFTGRLSEIKNIPLEYNHILNIMAAVGLFSFFVNSKPMGEKASGIVLRLSPMALGIYLLHESPAFRYTWQQLLGIKDITGLAMPLFLVRVLLAVLIVVIAGLCVDFVRLKLFSLCAKFLRKTKCCAKILKINEKVNSLNE